MIQHGEDLLGKALVGFAAASGFVCHLEIEVDDLLPLDVGGAGGDVQGEGVLALGARGCDDRALLDDAHGLQGHELAVAGADADPVEDSLFHTILLVAGMRRPNAFAFVCGEVDLQLLISTISI